MMPTPVIMAGDVIVGDAVHVGVPGSGFRVRELREAEVEHFYHAIRWT